MNTDTQRPTADASRSWSAQPSIRVILVALIAAAALAGVKLSAKQSCLSSTLVDQSGGTLWKLQAATTQTGCSNTTTIVDGWFTGFTFNCSGAMVGGWCHQQNGSANAGDVTPLPSPKNFNGGTLWADDCVDPDPPPSEDDCEPDEHWDGERCVPMNCPLIIATDKRQDYKLTSVEEGVPFDLNADGRLEQVAWTVADQEVAFLRIQ